MTRYAPTLAGITCTLLILATGCSSSGGDTQEGTSPSSEQPSTSASPTTTSPSPIWTPPDYGTAKSAVDAYLEFEVLVDKAFRDPDNRRSSTFDNYLSGRAKLLFDSALTDEKKEGKAYRGGAAINHARVLKNHVEDPTLPWVMLRDCQTNDPTNPHVEYYVKTGMPVSTSPASLTPYASTIKLFLINGQWTITQFNVDTSKACTP